jgi:hypothetical protein
MIIVASSLSLLAIVAGMFLYAKTLKDNLNLFFKIVSCFIIIVGFLNLFIGSAFMMIEKMYMHHQKMEMGSYEHHGKKMKKHMNKHWSNEGMDDENCECKTDKCCDEMGMMRGNECEMSMMKNKECCPSMMDKESCMKTNMMMKKDSIVMKKHHMK